MAHKKHRPIPSPVPESEASQVLAIARFACQKFYPNLDQHQREDLIGTAVLYLLETWHEYDPERGARSTWGAYKAHSAMQDALRRTHRAQGFSRDGRVKFRLVRLEDDIQIAPHETAPLSEIIAGEEGIEIDDGWLTQPLLYEALDQLPERMRSAMILHASGLKLHEVAGIFGVTESRISQLVSEARRRLQRDERVLAAAA